MITRNYDVLVVDPSPGALVAAALLARAGLSVLVLRDDPEPAGQRFRFLGHRPPIVGFQQGLLLPRVLKALKFHPHELAAVRKRSVGLQVITNRHRLDLAGQPDGLLGELRRELPGDADAVSAAVRRATSSAASFAEALQRAVDDAGQAGFLQNLGLARPDWSPPLPPEDVPTWGEFLAQEPISDEARWLLRGTLRPFCALDVVEDLPLPVAGMHLAAALDGVYADASEPDPLLSLLQRRVQAMRVDVQSEPLAGFSGNRRRIEAAHFDNRAEPLPLKLVITGGDPEDLLDWLPGGHKGYERALGRLAPSHFRYTIHLGVQDAVVPPDLAEHAILLDDERAVEDAGGCLLLSVTPPGSPLAPAGHRAMTCSTLLAYAEDGSLPQGIEGVAGRMLDRLKWLLPYLERHLEVLHVPTSEQPTEDEPFFIDTRPVAYTPAVPPADDPVSAGLGVSLPHRNLFCAGAPAFPALGLGGEALAGQLVERLAMASTKKA